MIDHVALLPAYVAAGTALLALVVDLAAPGRSSAKLLAVGMGTALVAVAGWWVYRGGVRSTFCVAGECSYRWDGLAALVAALFVAATLAVLGLSVPLLRSGDVPGGEYCFLLACSMTGGVVLGAARDLVTLVVALELLTLPLYLLVGLRRRSVHSAEAAVTFYVVSVVSTSITLLGVALLYAATGSVHFGPLAQALAAREELRSQPLVGVGVVAVLVGLAFKVAAVPLHAWAPPTYDGAPLPVAAYLSTASKVGGIVALLLVVAGPVEPWRNVAAPVVAVTATLSMTVGNLVALRQRRMVRLLAWSSVAQSGYLLAALAAFAVGGGQTGVVAVLAFTVFYVLMELGAFGAVVALRGSADGGELSEYEGAAWRRPWVTAGLVLALAGLAGLPPGLAGLFAKVVVVRALLDGALGWLAVVVALNAVVGMAYYLRAALVPFARGEDRTWPAVPLPVGVVLAAVTLAAAVVGVAPQLVLDAASLGAR